MLDVISIGDVTEDVFVEVTHAASVHCSSKHTCSLDFAFGTKLGITTVDKLIGGNAGNLAIGARRLGLNSALVAEVGDDSQGVRLKESLEKEKVNTKYFTLKKGAKTNYSVVLYYKGERTILVHHEKRSYRLPMLPKTKWVYLTSMAKGNEKMYPTLLRYLKKTKAHLGFNPGTYQLSLGLKKLQPLFKVATFVCMNTEEAQELLKTSSRDFRQLTKKLQATGPQIAVVTDGANGAYCYDGLSYWYCPIYHVPIIERTGAGDAFATGLLAGLANKKLLQDALAWGTINSASVVQKVGPQAGLITKKKLTAIYKAHPQFRARTLMNAEVKSKKKYIPKTHKKW